MKNKVVMIVSILAALLVLSVVKDFVLKVSVEKGVEMVTGLRLEIKSFQAGILRSVVSIKGLKLYNPPAFKDKVMADMPEIYVDYDLFAIFGGTVHLKALRINLKEFIVVKNEKGELNLNSLKSVTASKDKTKTSKAETKAAAMPKIRIDSFELKVGRALYKDYTASGSPSIKEFNVNLDKRYTNITDPYSLVSIIVVEALANTSIAGLTNFDVGALKGTVSETLSAAQKTAAKAASAAQDAIKTTAEKTVGSLQDVLKNPFGSDKK